MLGESDDKTGSRLRNRVAISPRTTHAFSESLEAAERPRRRGVAALLASTVFTGAFIAVMTGNPQSALAACLNEDSPSVTCSGSNPATAGTLNTTFNGTTVVDVNAGGKINTGGAIATVTDTGSLTFNNNDTTYGIRSTTGVGVDLRNNFGAITYVGNANVTATSPGTSGIQASAGAAGDISITNNATA
jgi:subtilase-type serine protease